MLLILNPFNVISALTRTLSGRWFDLNLADILRELKVASSLSIYLTFFIWFLSFSYLPPCKEDMISLRLCSSLLIATNSSLSSIFFDFPNILIVKNIKNLPNSCFSFLYYFHFWKKSKKIGWKLNTSNFSTIKWKRWELSNSSKYTIPFLHFHLIESI